MASPFDSAAEISAIAELLRAGDPAAPASAAGAAGRFHLSPARANLLRHLDLTGLEVLELQAGCGGLSRSLAERARRLVAVEPRPDHREALVARLRDLPAAQVLAGIGEAEGLFDLAVVVESRHGEPAEDLDRRLRSASEKLRAGGILALACSNRLGLGSFAGQPDRASGAYFEGIAGGGEGRSRLEWRRHIENLGLAVRAEYLLSPDVWLPSCVLKPELIGEDPELAADLVCHLPFADPRLPVFPLLPPALFAESVARGGLLADLAPGFLWLCGRSSSGPLLAALQQAHRPASREGGNDTGSSLGWHYSSERRPATETRFYSRGDELRVAKRALTPPPELDGVRWTGDEDQPLLRGRRWRLGLLRSAYFETGRFEDELAGLLAELASSFKAEGGRLRGEALDALFHNALVGEDGITRLFDLEWSSREPLETSWWVLRNVLALAPSFETIAHGIGSRNLGELYGRLCARLSLAPALAADLEREAAFQARLGGGDASSLAGALAALLERPLQGSPFPPRHSEKLGPWGQEMHSKSIEIDRLSSAFEGLTKLSADVRWLAEAVDRQQRSLESIDEALRWLAGKIVERP